MATGFKQTEPCTKCSRNVFGIEKIVVEGKPLHENCFRCHMCNEKLTLNGYGQFNSCFYCTKDFYALTRSDKLKDSVQLVSPRPLNCPEIAANQASSPPCSICGKRVFNVAGLTITLENDKVMHKSCFVCSVCNDYLTESSHHFAEGKYFCPRHYFTQFNYQNRSYSEIVNGTRNRSSSDSIQRSKFRQSQLIPNSVNSQTSHSEDSLNDANSKLNDDSVPEIPSEDFPKHSDEKLESVVRSSGVDGSESQSLDHSHHELDNQNITTQLPQIEQHQLPEPGEKPQHPTTEEDHSPVNLEFSNASVFPNNSVELISNYQESSTSSHEEESNAISISQQTSLQETKLEQSSKIEPTGSAEESTSDQSPSVIPVSPRLSDSLSPRAKLPSVIDYESSTDQDPVVARRFPSTIIPLNPAAQLPIPVAIAELPVNIPGVSEISEAPSSARNQPSETSDVANSVLSSELHHSNSETTNHVLPDTPSKKSRSKHGDASKRRKKKSVKDKDDPSAQNSERKSRSSKKSSKTGGEGEESKKSSSKSSRRKKDDKKTEGSSLASSEPNNKDRRKKTDDPDKEARRQARRERREKRDLKREKRSRKTPVQPIIDNDLHPDVTFPLSPKSPISPPMTPITPITPLPPQTPISPDPLPIPSVIPIEPKPRDRDSSELKSPPHDSSEPKSRDRNSSEPKPRDRNSSEPKPRDRDSSEPKPRNRDSSEAKSPVPSEGFVSSEVKVGGRGSLEDADLNLSLSGELDASTTPVDETGSAKSRKGIIRFPSRKKNRAPIKSPSNASLVDSNKALSTSLSALVSGRWKRSKKDVFSGTGMVRSQKTFNDLSDVPMPEDFEKLPPLVGFANQPSPVPDIKTRRKDSKKLPEVRSEIAEIQTESTISIPIPVIPPVKKPISFLIPSPFSEISQLSHTPNLEEIPADIATLPLPQREKPRKDPEDRFHLEYYDDLPPPTSYEEKIKQQGLLEPPRVVIGVIGFHHRIMELLSLLISSYPRQIDVFAISLVNQECEPLIFDRYGDSVKILTSPLELLNLAQIEWVFIHSDVESCQFIEAALRAGKHVFCEKPLLQGLDACLNLRATITKTKKHLLCGLIWRYVPLYQEICALLEDGILGDIISVEMTHLLDPAQAGLLMCDWTRKQQLAGTLCMTYCYDLDLLNWLVNALPRSVVSFGGLSSFTKARAPVEIEYLEPYLDWDRKPISGVALENPFTSDKDILDNQMVILEYMNNVHASLHINANSAFAQQRVLICGSDGTLEADLFTGLIRFKQIGSIGFETIQVTPGDGHGDSDQMLMEGLMMAALKNDLVYSDSAERLFHSLITVAGINRSQENHTIINLEDCWTKL